MGLNHSPSIVTNGLVLCLDAANIKSYPGSGTTWSDLTPNKNDVTLTNGPTFNSANKGSIVFDGNNDYANFYAPNLDTIATVEVWVKLGANYTNQIMFGWYAYDVYCLSGKLGYNTGNSDLLGISSATVTNLGLVDNWKHYVFEMRTDVSYSNNKIYINGQLMTLDQAGTEAAANRTFNSGNGKIAGWRVGIGYSMPMDCSVFKVYNRALSATEIKQNYNALRGRFGI